ncbi:hypothetical protein FB45DRAFT_893378 [Roridomyces roridus]|uniref:Smr domain-containing protein n=1 Tax=Roridomyces roridus TaxID=1738132 RepID=A0AAD7CFD4_9AGAR|nr:hypothetical protein FB45DRAFT_893378 [Roridomyces roridus]
MSFLATCLSILCGASSDSSPGDGHQTQQPSVPVTQQPRPQAAPDSEWPKLESQQHRPPQSSQNEWQQPHPHKPHHQQEQQPHHKPEQHHKPHHADPNQVNQHDPHYMRLRAQANEEGDQMGKCFSESQAAYTQGDGARAKELSNQGHAHQARMHSLNKEASDWIFIENNKDSKPGEIDLHGLYVKEAIERTDLALEQAKRRGDTEIHLIVGKGLHSEHGVAKLKPAIEEVMQKHQLSAVLDPHNAGVLVVQIGGGQGGVGSDEITRRLERSDEGCTIM